MGGFTLKNGITVEYDSENSKFVFTNADVQKGRKITSRAFPSILGKNKWESSGKTILERYGLIEKEQIDPYYLVRGNLAEKIAYDYLKNHYKTKKNTDITLATWNKDEIHYDNFPKNEKFGGMIDIAISSPQEFRAVVEVKSKSMKDFESIKGNNGNEEEVLQGVFLTYLSQAEKCLMVYVFFTPEQEKAIKDGTGQNIGFEDVKIMVFKHMVSDYDMPTLTTVAFQNLQLFKASRSIASIYFSKEECDYLQKLAGGEMHIIEDDLPF
jgi:hypothetical protein